MFGQILSGSLLGCVWRKVWSWHRKFVSKPRLLESNPLVGNRRIIDILHTSVSDNDGGAGRILIWFILASCAIRTWGSFSEGLLPRECSDRFWYLRAHLLVRWARHAKFERLVIHHDVVRACWCTKAACTSACEPHGPAHSQSVDQRCWNGSKDTSDCEVCLLLPIK